MIVPALRTLFEEKIYTENPELNPKFTRFEIDFLGSLGSVHEHKISVFDTRLDECIFKAFTESLDEKLVRYSPFNQDEVDEYDANLEISKFLDSSTKTVVVSNELLKELKNTSITQESGSTGSDDWFGMCEPSDDEIFNQEKSYTESPHFRFS
ncbi:hypothetical protein [Vibrio sp. D431a]|uniref:hypothetical protein n=1 Tax=Vibrio sp. D431a TaxID=2837388 RepID=UPI002557AAF2|nr:hypothetical protein [Vibrio sp. D431a]MDK9790152.1 hypothetical protein [Vibrio sp. D431a]